MQIVDMGLERSVIEQHLRQTGYWGCEHTRIRNAFVLSPCAYVVSGAQRSCLDRISRAVYAGVSMLGGKISSLARLKRLENGEAFFLGLAKSGVRGLLTPYEYDGRVPPIMKVDIMQTRDGTYAIAEVDAYNPRGFGYLELLNGTIPNGFRPCGPGVRAIAQELALQTPGASWTIIVSEMERYYEPTFHILAHALRAKGVQAEVVRESVLAEDAKRIEAISHVFVVPSSCDIHPHVRNRLMERVRDGSLSCFFPPAAFLGSKAFLPFLEQQGGLGEWIPSSALVCRREDPRMHMGGEDVLLKGVMSSGHKNIIFSSRDRQRFEETLASALRQQRPAWMMQREVKQDCFPMVVFDNDGVRHTRSYFLRLTAYISMDGLVGLEVTGRENGFVHGAPDCIQIPAVLL